jgi:isochorismate pyruvate lyase
MTNQEPDTRGAPLRSYTDPAYRPLCATLADVRANIDRLDDEIVRLIAERAMYVKDAARFKRDAFQVRQLAERHDRGFANLDQVVDATYRAMVAAFIANEQTYFNAMKDLGDTHA